MLAISWRLIVAKPGGVPDKDGIERRRTGARHTTSRSGELESPPGGSRAAVGRYFALAALGLAGPLSFMDRSTEMVSPFFTSARAAGGKCTIIVPSDVFTCTQPVFALTLVTVPSMLCCPVI